MANSEHASRLCQEAEMKGLSWSFCYRAGVEVVSVLSEDTSSVTVTTFREGKLIKQVEVAA